MSDTANPETSGAASGGVRTLLRLEGLALFTGMTLLYGVWDGSWWVYAILFLAPDLSFAGYLAGPRAGAVIYNAACPPRENPISTIRSGSTRGCLAKISSER